MLRTVIAAMLLVLSVSAARAALICNIDDVVLDFGAVDTLGSTAPNTSANILVHCSGATESTITLCANIGAGTGGASGGLREMSGSPPLKFGLYASAGTSIPWGSTDTTGLGSPQRIELATTDGSANGSVTIYGVIPTGQGAVASGPYSTDLSNDVDFKYAEGTGLDCSAPGGALDTSANFTVAASVPENCLLETHDLDFGTTGLIGTAIDADTNMDITCTPGTAYTISIDGGSSGDPENRLMHSGANTVRYGLYSNAQRSTTWGTDAQSVVSGTGTGAGIQQGVYGRIPPQSAAAGQYTDTVVVMVSY